MNHYPHHIGDFNTATRHLSRLERAIYRDMLDMYYDTEAPLDGSDFDRLARRLLCRDSDEVAALQFVLDEFFEQQADGRWVHHRCEREIAAFKLQQADRGVVKSNEKQRQHRSRAARGAMFSALRALGVVPDAKTKNAELRILCTQYGVDLSGIYGDSGGGGGVTAPVTAHAVTSAVTDTACHANGTGNQNQNQNHIKPPNPPAGGASGGLAIATALSAHFPLHRRTRIAEVAELVNSLQASGEVTGEQLLEAAGQQADLLGKDNGKACPGVLGWLRRKGWLDSAALPAGGGIAADWSATRSGIEAMGQRVGLPAWEESGYRLLEQYEAEVRRRLAEQGVPA